MVDDDKKVASCLPRCKDTNLKAIHNLNALPQSDKGVVYHDVKIQIWKQFTTTSVEMARFVQLSTTM